MSKRISFCTIAMNRTHHIAKTLPINLADNEDFDNCEFVLLDYNSTDGLEDFVRSYLKRYIDNGRLVYFRTDLPQYFRRGHALNSAMRLSSGDIICNIDADNYTGRGFARYIHQVFKNNDSIFLTPDLEKHGRDVCGRVCLLRKNFLKIGGYDEQIENWGHDDDDIKNRLRLSGLKEVHIEGNHFLNAISHGHDERLKNEYIMKNLHKILLCHVSPSVSHLLLLLKDHKFIHGDMINNFAVNSDSIDNCLTPPPYEFRYDMRHDTAFQGEWNEIDRAEFYEMTSNDRMMLRLWKTEKGYTLKHPHGSNVYSEVSDEEDIHQIILRYSFANNRVFLKNNAVNASPVVNVNGMGKGIFYKNFNTAVPLETK